MNKFYSNVVNPKDFKRKSNGYLMDVHTRHSKSRNLMGFALLFLFSLFGSFSSIAQTVLINPAAEGGFENGATFAANGWTVSNFTPVLPAVPNPWTIRPITNGAITGNAAIISSDGTTPSYVISSSCTNYFYRDISVPAGQGKIKLDFNWLCGGESIWDMWQVFVAPTTITPVAGLHSGSGAVNVPAAITGATFVGNGNLQAATVQATTLFLPPSLAGTTFRLIFVWKSDTSGGVQPPAQIDNISLVSSTPGNYISIATGDWSAASTWDLGTSPSPVDNATISVGHAVSVNALNQGVNNLVVNGNLAYAATPTTFITSGNLTVANGGTITAFQGIIGKNLTVGGNIINNGTIDLSIGTTTAGSLTLNGTAVQTVSGSGTFVGDVIRNLIFSNTNTATPNINWSVNNVKIAYNLNLTGARINLGANKITFGNNAAGNTLTAPVGTGFLPGGKFSRWWTNAATGTGITAGIDPTGTLSSYPFITASGLNRTMYITRTNSTNAVAGELAVVYNHSTTITPDLSIADGPYSITDRYNGNWVVSDEFSTISSSSYRIALFAPNGLVPSNGNSRVMGASAAIGGLHQNGTVTPSAQRIDVPQADLLAGPLYVGINADDIPYLTIASGNWNNDSIWNKGIAPACGDPAAIGAGTTVTVNSAGNFTKNITIVPGATLIIASGDLTTGCLLKNNLFVNNGTLTVSGGTLTVNGNIVNNAGSTLNQSGGDIVVDGNDGEIANSVLTGTPLFRVTASGVANLNLTGGNIRIINPHRGTSTVDASFSISQAVAPNAASKNHTVLFGDGSSTISAGSTGGFFMNLFVGAQYYSLGNVVVDGGTALNRFLRTSGNIGILGNLTVTSGEYQMATSTFVAGNIVNNGTISATGLLAMGTFVAPNSVAPSILPQSISGTGVFRNSLTLKTADLTNFQVSNSSSAGLTLNVPLSVSGTLTTTSGFINTTDANILSLGTLTIAGTLAGTQNETTFIRGPFTRTIATGNLGTNYILFPVGKSSYSPISLAPTTTSVSIMKAESFDVNAGTAGSGISNLSANRRWTTNLVSGAFTNTRVRLGDATITTGKIPVLAPTAAGAYIGAFGSTATFTAGTPNVIQSDATVTAADFTGFLSFAESNACLGIPNPGNTIASSTSFCLGQTVVLSLQNQTGGSGVSYQWKSSPNGLTYTAIVGATGPTYTFTPTVNAFYQCDVTCVSGPATAASTAVQVASTNTVTTTTPATRCGTGTLNLNATTGAGATLNWYANATGGQPLTGGSGLASGTPFTTPSINATTTYFVSAIVGGGTLTDLGNTSVPTATGNFSQRGIVFNATTAFTLVSAQYYSPTLNITNSVVVVLQNSAGVQLQTVTLPIVQGATPGFYTMNLNWNIPVGTGYRLLAAFSTTGAVNRITTGVDYTLPTFNNLGSVGTITSGWDSSVSTTSYNYFHNISVSSGCESPREAVIATVTPAPTFTVTPASTICNNEIKVLAVTSTTADFDTYIWSGNGLFTDAAATIPYVHPASGNLTTVYFSTATAGNATITCNATNSVSSCAAAATSVQTVLPNATISASNPNICVSGSTVLSLVPATGYGAGSIQWQNSLDGVSYNDITGQIGVAYTTPVLTTTTFYRAIIKNGAGSTCSTPTYTAAVNSPVLLTTTPGIRCGVGSVSLNATANAGNTLNWYANATGGQPLPGGAGLASGTPFASPSINATTTYFVSATSGGTNLTDLGNTSVPTATGNFSQRGIVFNATSAFTLVSAQYYSPTLNITNSVVVVLQNSAGVQLQTVTLPIVQGATPGFYTMNLNWNIPVGTGYRLLAAFSTTGAVNRITTGVNYALPAFNNLGSVGIITSGWDSSVSTTSYNYFHNISVSSGCESAREAVVATVTTSPSITLSATTTTVCSGSPSAAITIATGASNFDTFVWSPPAGVSGNSTTGWTFNPTVATTYTLTASQSTGALCAATASVAVAVNPIPTPIVFAANPATVCLDQIQSLSVTGGTLGVSGKIGSGVIANTTSTPFKGFWGGSKMQALYTAAELTTLGLQSGQSISSIGFVATAGTPLVLNGFTFSAGFVSTATLGTTLISGANNVILAPTNYTPSTGIGNLDFPVTTPLIWDGVSNLLIETCFNNNDGGGASANSITVESSTVATGLNIYNSKDSTPGLCAETTATSSTSRPNLRITAQQNTQIVWSPITNLFTDAAATIAYTAGTSATIVYYKSATAGSNTYTVTGSTPLNCSVTATTTISTLDCGISFANLQSPATATIKTCDTQTFNAQVFKAGVTEAAGQGAGITAWIGRSTTNTNPATWSEASWQLATFNVQSNDNDEYQATFGPLTAGTYYVASRFRFTNGAFAYGGYSTTGGGIWSSTTNTSATLIVEAIAAPTGTATQDFTTGQTLANFTVVGQNIIWYTAATGGTVLPSTTVLVSGTTYFASQTVSGCESTTRLAVTAGTDLQTPGFELSNLSYYPNPVKDVLTVAYSEEIQGVQLYNMLGQLVLNRNTNTSKVTIDMASMASGSYILKVTVNGLTQNVKVIKE